MALRSSTRDALLIITGAVVSLVLLLIMWHFRETQSPAQRIALRNQRLELTSRLQLALTAASEAEKSAVMAITDRDSLAYADQSRAAMAKADRESAGLAKLLATGGTQREKDLLTRFSAAFAELKRVDGDILALAVKNTNLKAYSLAFGPAADALTSMSESLSRVVARSAGSSESARIEMLALRAQNAALRVQTLLAPHIGEESNKRMDEFEARMGKDEQKAEADLVGLAALPKLSADPDLEAANADFHQFKSIKKEIIALSRENTNVRSLAISLGQGRKAMVQCDDALNELQRAIRAEPVSTGREPNPRLMERTETINGR